MKTLPFALRPLSLALMLLPASLAQAHNPAVLDEVLVSAPLHKSSAETALPVSILHGDRLRDQATGTLGGSLEQTPGIHNASFGPGVGQPVIRGQHGPRVQVLQNGIATADAASVSADHATATEPLLAESVEVLRGPATLLYGGGAIGGVVNVIDNRIPTRPPEKAFSGALEQRHDSASDGNTSVLRLDGGVGSIAWHLSGVYRDWNDLDINGLAFNRKALDDWDESSKGVINNSHGRNDTLTAGLSWIFDTGYLGFSVSHANNHYGIPSGGHVHAHGEDHDHDHDDDHGHAGHGDIRIDMQYTRYDAAGEWRELGPVLDTLRWRLTYTDYQHHELEGGVRATSFRNETWENRVELSHAEIGGWRGAVGLQLKQRKFAATGEEAFVPESRTESAGLFLIEDYRHGHWLHEFGLRVDWDRLDVDGVHGEERFTSRSASFSSLWDFAPNWQAGLALSYSQRAPVVEELYANHDRFHWHDDHYHFHDPVTHAATQSLELGNPELDRETSRNADLSLRYQGQGFRASVTAFYNDFDDYIYLHNTGFEYEETPVLAYRQQDARFYGLEFDSSIELGDFFDLEFYGDAVRGRLDDGTHVPRLPPYRIGSRLRFHSGGFGAYVGYLHGAKQERAGQHEIGTDSYHRIDAGLHYSIGFGGGTELRLFVNGKNLSNKTLRNSSSFLRHYAPEAGRSADIGFRFSF